MVPGMQHCVTGSGPNVFDTLTALEQWVEKGIAPDAIPTTHLKDNVVDRTMPLCKFPEKAHFKGSGDPNSVANWSCPQTTNHCWRSGPMAYWRESAQRFPRVSVLPAKQAASKSGN